MKGLLKIVFGLLVSAVLTNARSRSYTRSMIPSVPGNVSPKTLKSDTIKCESLICPQTASHCRVTRRIDPTNSKIMIRHRTCLDKNGGVVLVEKVKEPNFQNPNSKVNEDAAKFLKWLNNMSDSTSEEQRELEEKLRRNKKNVKKNQDGNNKNVKKNQKQLERDEKFEKLRRKQQEIEPQISGDT